MLPYANYHLQPGALWFVQLMVGRDQRLVNVSYQAGRNSYLYGAEDQMDGGFCHVVGFSSKLYPCCALNSISS